MSSKRKKITLLITLVTLALVVMGLWLWLPHFLLNRVNDALSRLEGYEGSARSVNISMLRGSYTIHDLSLHKKGGRIPDPFFKASSITIAVDWKSLLKGTLSSELEVAAPTLYYVNSADEKSTQLQIDDHWPAVLTRLLPFPLNRFAVQDGSVQFRDEQSTPVVALRMDSITLRGVNLLNVDKKENRLPATVTGAGVHPTGTVSLSIRLDPSPTLSAFEMHAEINTLQLSTLQEFVYAYGHCDVEKGTLSLFIDAASEGSSITGSVRPVFTDLDADQSKGAASDVARYPVTNITWKMPHLPNGPVAEFKVEGSLTGDTNPWNVIGETLRYASYHAVIPTIQHTVALKKAAAARQKKNSGMVTVTAKADEKKGLFKRLFRKK